MTNTKQEWLAPKLPNTEILDQGATQTDNVAAKLEGDLQEERDSRKEERFYWIFTLLMVGNVALFNGFSSNWALLPTFLLELVLLIALADWLGVDRVKVPLEKLYAKWINS